MKSFLFNAIMAFLSTMLLVLVSSHASASQLRNGDAKVGKCADQAKIAAAQFVRESGSATELKRQKFTVDKLFLSSEDRGILYYSVMADAGAIYAEINVGLAKDSCQFVAANFAGDEN